MAPNTEKVEFPGASGALLSARLDSPLAPPIAYALFAHCFTCSKDTRAAAYVAAALAERGIACLRFDFTGLGGSGGDFANTNFSSNRADLVAAVDFLRRRYRAPELLVGHSLGGAAVLAAAHEIPEAVGVATIAAPSDPAHVLALIPKRDEIERTGEAEVVLGGRTFRIRRQLLDDLAGQQPDERLRDLGKALLVMHSPRDETVMIDNATRIFQAARHPKSFVSLDARRSPAHAPRGCSLCRPRDRRVGGTLSSRHRPRGAGAGRGQGRRARDTGRQVHATRRGRPPRAAPRRARLGRRASTPDRRPTTCCSLRSGAARL